MVEIRMRWQLPCTVRFWPPVGEICEVSEEEAERLVRNRYAEYVNAPEDDEDFDDETLLELERLDSAEVGLDSDSDFEADDFDSDFEDDESEFTPRPKVTKKPRTVDPKTKWLEYARSKGYTGDDTITKNRLIAEYGD